MRARSAFLTTAGVLAALAVVAVSSRGSTPAGDGRTRTPRDALVDLLFTLYVLALLGGAILFVYLLVVRRRMKAELGVAGGRRTFFELLSTGVVLVALALLAARSISGREPPTPPIVEEDILGPGGAFTTSTGATVAGATRSAEFAWGPAAVTVGLVVLALGAWWFAGRSRRRARGELRPGLAADLSRALDESLDDLRAERNPRRAVIAAYARLERVLAAHELPRRPAEAPLEYLGRMLAELSVRERAARELTELFETAKFSQHAVGPEMKEQAIAALETVRDDLLSARALAEREQATGHQSREGAVAP